ncbi:MAG: right-handed parallel beta-helix repeat-containing protein, partial [Nitrososphaerales archaeon]
AIIDGSANSNVPVISVNGFLANSVEINGFEIRNGLNGIEVSSLSPSGGCTNFDTNGIIIGNNYIHDNASGILFDNTCLGRVHDNKIHNNKIGVELGNNSDTNYFIHNDIFKSGAEGILVSDSASNGNTFHHNFLRQNTAWGIDAFDGNILKENIANKNGAGGYRLMNSNIVTDNQAKNSGTMPSPANGYSIEGSGNKLTGNLGKKNTGDGFFAAMTSSGNTFTSNRGIENGSFGFNDDSTGAGTAGTNNTYVKNRCRDNVVGGSQPSGLCIPQP